MAVENLFLICNAHLDPVWQWEWEEGAAEAISTFRTAADLCEEFDGFVFNHNEAVLYEWVEEYEPELFRRIQKLVKAGKWHVMGGWFLQPDCNMPSGESFVRQVLYGRRYFREKFGVAPSTAINLDPFGHSRGLAQILARSGFDAYLFCRPGQEDCALEGDYFIWVGFDGSEVLACRAPMHYNAPLGKAREKVEQYLERYPDAEPGIVLWGVGDHGGGPSREDIRRLDEMIAGDKERRIRHARPEDFFACLEKQREDLPRREQDINPWAVGCYTSQVRLKQKHRELENELYMVEKMASTAALSGKMGYPREELREAMRDLLFAEFHDILPGSSIQPVEDTSLRLLDHGLEILSRVKARTFFSLASGEKKAKEGEIPVLVYNPHPYKVRTVVECEFQLADIGWEDAWTEPTAYQRGKPLPTQTEKEAGNLSLDWRKKVVFVADLAPSRINRFDCRLRKMESRPRPTLKEKGGRITFRTGELEVVINCRTGTLDRYRAGGIDYLAPGGFRPTVFADNEDPWGSQVRRYSDLIGRFKPLNKERAARLAGVDGELKAVRVIEDGQVRAVVEVLLGFGDSEICQHFLLPRQGTRIGVRTRVHWNEKSRLLKLAVPTTGPFGRFLGQVAYGAQDLPVNGDEAVAQKWVAVVDDEGDRAISVVDDGTYGSSFWKGCLYLTLMHSPAYAALPIFDRPLVPADRYTPRIDQGERLFSFWMDAGGVKARLERIDREALADNEKPFVLSFFPSGLGEKPQPGPRLSDRAVQMTALKMAEDGDELIVRLFEPTGKKRSTTLTIPGLGIKEKVRLGVFEIKTLKIDAKTGKVEEVDLMEGDGLQQAPSWKKPGIHLQLQGNDLSSAIVDER